MIEIWNLVFIQFNRGADRTLTPLPAKHVDTGMGFERVTSIIQGTKDFTDFANARISNYETDIFRPIFDELEKLSGQRYASTEAMLEDLRAVRRAAAATETEQCRTCARGRDRERGHSKQYGKGNTETCRHSFSP